jgi:predicted nucleotide-binding protein
MAKKKIFIGSSVEGKPQANDIAEALVSAGYFEPIRWWEEFGAGSITIEVLSERSKNCDGAIFLMTPDDMTWYRGEEKNPPRDNRVWVVSGKPG